MSQFQQPAYQPQQPGGQYQPQPYASPQGAPPAQGWQPPQQGYVPQGVPVTQPGYPQQPQQGYAQPAYAPPPVQPNMGGQQAPAWGQPRQPHPGMFAGINTAKPSGNYQYLKQPGTYWLRVDLCKYDDGRTTNKGLEFFVVELTVIKVLDNAAGRSHTLGSSVSAMMMPSNRMYFQKDMNKILGALLGVSFDQVTPEAAMAMFGPQQPFTHMVLETVVQTMPKRQGPGESARVSYKRAVPSAEVLAGLPPEHVNSFFPGGILQRMAAAEAAAGHGQAQQPVQQPQYPPVPPPGNYQPQAPYQQPYQPQAAAPAPLPAPNNGPPPGAWQQPR